MDFSTNRLTFMSVLVSVSKVGVCVYEYIGYSFFSAETANSCHVVSKIFHFSMKFIYKQTNTMWKCEFKKTKKKRITRMLYLSLVVSYNQKNKKQFSTNNENYNWITSVLYVVNVSVKIANVWSNLRYNIVYIF